MVSNAKDVLPDPEGPVQIVILSLGMVTVRCFKLFCSAPTIVMSWMTDLTRSFFVLRLVLTISNACSILSW